VATTAPHGDVLLSLDLNDGITALVEFEPCPSGWLARWREGHFRDLGPTVCAEVLFLGSLVRSFAGRADRAGMVRFTFPSDHSREV